MAKSVKQFVIQIREPQYPWRKPDKVWCVLVILALGRWKHGSQDLLVRHTRGSVLKHKVNATSGMTPESDLGPLHASIYIYTHSCMHLHTYVHVHAYTCTPTKRFIKHQHKSHIDFYMQVERPCLGLERGILG